jgi:type II secretory pathway pseudopilin PulG
MQEFWDWLRYNSAQLQTFGGLAQAIGSIAAVVIAALLAWVAKRQANAADQQATAAVTQARAARVQISTSLFIADKQVSPNFSITAATSRDNVIVKGKISILNNGSGAAQDVGLTYRDSSLNSDIALSSSTLVVRDSIGVLIDEARARSSGLILQYSTIYGTKYALDFEWDSSASRSINERLRLVHSRLNIPVDQADEL